MLNLYFTRSFDKKFNLFCEFSFNHFFKLKKTHSCLIPTYKYNSVVCH